MYGRLGCVWRVFFYWLGFVGLAHSGVTYDAYAVYDGAIGNGQFQAKYVIRETPDTGVRTYKRTEALYPAARAKSLIVDGIKQSRNAGIGVAVAAAVAGAGWAMDELTGQITGGAQVSDGYEQGFYWNSSADGNWRYPTSSEVDSRAREFCSEIHPSGFTENIGAGVRCLYHNSVGATLAAYTSYAQKNVCVGIVEPYCPSSPPSSTASVSGADFLDLLADVLSSKDLQQLLTDRYGNPLLTPELIDAMKKLANPNSDPANTNEVDETPPEGQEEPEFCKQKVNKGNPLCEESDTPEIQEIPTVSIEVVDWSSGLGSGSCPSARSTSFQGQSVTYDYSEACGAITSYMRPITIAGAVLASAFILVGVRV